MDGWEGQNGDTKAGPKKYHPVVMAQRKGPRKPQGHETGYFPENLSDLEISVIIKISASAVQSPAELFWINSIQSSFNWAVFVLAVRHLRQKSREKGGLTFVPPSFL